jgi:hypothetical protein
MGGKAKPTKHTAKEIAGRIAASTQNKGGGKAGLADRKGGSAVRVLPRVEIRRIRARDCVVGARTPRVRGAVVQGRRTRLLAVGYLEALRVGNRMRQLGSTLPAACPRRTLQAQGVAGNATCGVGLRPRLQGYGSGGMDRVATDRRRPQRACRTAVTTHGCRQHQVEPQDQWPCYQH